MQKNPEIFTLCIHKSQLSCPGLYVIKSFYSDQFWFDIEKRGEVLLFGGVNYPAGGKGIFGFRVEMLVGGDNNLAYKSYWDITERVIFHV